MFIQQMYTNCLAHAAYYIESGREAVIIDPLRNPEPYVHFAKERGAAIKYILETHFHADFVSGHIDLANDTGATIVFGPNAQPEYKAYVAEDGELLAVGEVKIKVLHTPGHTIESACYLLYDEEGKEYAVFSGDTLFVGDVGRPDLLSGNHTKEELAAMMYESLQNKIMTLPDNVIVYPGHGAGSACGKNIGTASFSTIRHEKLFNYALNTANKEAFIEAVTTDLPVIPEYFFMDAKTNIKGYEAYSGILARGLHPLSPHDFEKYYNEGAVVLDTRNPMDFAAGYVTGAINIGLNGDFAVWVGSLIPTDSTLLLVTEAGKEHEAIERLARIGYDNVVGYLQGGIDKWVKEGHSCSQIITLSSSEVQPLMEIDSYFLLDVRNRKEVAKHRIAGSLHIPLNQLKGRLPELEKSKKWLIYCAGGYRSMIAASYLRANGFHYVASIEGGINEIAAKAPELLEIDVE